jgi:hypothetical protein
MKSRLILFAVIIFAISMATAISFAQRKPETEKPISGDFKITIKTTMAGMPTQSTTMIKGLRERSETNMSMGGMNMSQTSITQCDLRRTIQINDRARKYMISPMDSDETNDASTSAAAGAAMGGTSRRGGLVTMTVNTVDTGERKDMFGFTARHLKRTMTSQSSPDACGQQQMKIETDGWYINLEYGLSCPTQRPPQRPGMSSTGCRDRHQYKHNGPSNLGYPLIETTTMYGADGSATFTMTKEVIELSRQTLDAALFDVPAGYTLANSQQEMNGAPSMVEIMAMAGQQPGQTNSESGQSSMAGMPSNSKTTGKARIGVVELNNKTKTSVSTDSLRDQLVAALNGEGVDAISLNASSASEAEIEAKAKGCAYILYTDISSLKAASAGKKIGGLLGRATGVGSSDTGKSEARLDFRLIPVGSSSPTVQSSVSTKEDTQEASVSGALQSEAKAVAVSVNKM